MTERMEAVMTEWVTVGECEGVSTGDDDDVEMKMVEVGEREGKYGEGWRWAVVTMYNFQQYRHISPPGWTLGWKWAKKEVIWSMMGSQTTEQGRTLGEFEELRNILSSVSFDFSKPETWSWDLASNGLFSVKKLTDIITSASVHSLTTSSQVSETLRNNLVPKKVEIFVWRLLKKRIPVRVELDKRGVDLHSTRCPICDDQLESVDHFLFSCNFSFDVWSRIFQWWGVNLSTNHNSGQILSGTLSSAMSSLGSKIWQAVEWICVYYLWKNRNMKVFKNKHSISPVIVSEIQVMTFDWISGKLKGKKIDWQTWLTNPKIYLNI
ncbi:uncharacterized protein [Rutidosis leptorrhynchoides]|uniref:uncharacterized protein n=1 Tax=Rutidosis leptorrhynchoides TaxID=125765 RepID=UPI003A99C6D6